MKHLILYLATGLLFLFISCDPIDDRDSAGAIIDPSEFQYTITQDPMDDYIIYLKNETPEVFFSWDYAWGTTTRQQDTVRILVAGTYKIKITGTTAGGLVYDEQEITVTKNDPDAFQEPEWPLLTNMKDGKTWVWDTGKEYPWGNGGYMGCTSSCWWVVTPDDLAGRGVLNDEMTFDLNGGRHLTLVAETTPEAGTTEGTFNLDMTSTLEGWSVGLLTTQNVTIINGIDVNNGNVKFYDYYILKLTEDELHLSAAQPGTGSWGEAWFWQFKPKN